MKYVISRPGLPFPIVIEAAHCRVDHGTLWLTDATGQLVRGFAPEAWFEVWRQSRSEQASESCDETGASRPEEA